MAKSHDKGRIVLRDAIAQAERLDEQAVAHARAFFEAGAIEHAPTRVIKLTEALWLLQHGVRSVRAAGKLAGVASVTGLQRYWTIAKAVNDGKPAPAGQATWGDAWANLSLETMVAAVSERPQARPVNEQALAAIERTVNAVRSLAHPNAGRGWYVPDLPAALAEYFADASDGNWGATAALRQLAVVAVAEISDDTTGDTGDVSSETVDERAAS